MASSSQQQHSNNRLCNKCSFKIIQFYRKQLEKFWIKINSFIEYKSLPLGDISKNITLVMFDDQYETTTSGHDEEQTASSSDDKSVLEKIKQIKTLDTTVIRAPFFGDQEEDGFSFKNLCEVYITLENIHYIDFELLTKMFKVLHYLFKKHEKTLSNSIKCSDGIPRLSLNDITLYTQESFIMKKQSRPMCIQVKGTLYNEKTSKGIDFVSQLQKKMNMMIEQTNGLLAERLTHKTVIDIHKSDVSRLKSHLDLLFSDLCGDEIVKYDIHLIRCRNNKLIDPSFTSYIISNRINTIIMMCDAVFCIKNYCTMYLLSILSKYHELIMNDSFKSNGNTTYSTWKLMYLGIEKDLQPKSIYDTDDIIVGFSLQLSDKDDFFDDGASSSSSNKKRVRFSDEKSSTKRTRS